MNENAPIVSFLQTTALDEDARRDPYPRLNQLRTQCPVFHDEGAKAYMFTRYADVRSIVNDRSLWRSPKSAEEGSLQQQQEQVLLSNELDPVYREAQSILSLDDPDHTRIRTPLAKALYARVAKVRPLIDATVGEVLDRTAGRATFDLIAELALPIPILIIARILGVDEERVAEFRAWSEAAVLSLSPMRSEEDTRRMIWGSNAIAEYFSQLMAARRVAPKDDLVSDMVTLGADITDAELNVNLSALLIGGNLTTTDLIGNGTWLLLTHPQELAKLKADPGLVNGTVEEILRFESPVDATGRIVSDEREIAGCPMHTHQSMFASLRAANRDPETFEAPDRFDITRKHVSHVAFGGGAHICIGAPLARAEAQSVFTQLFARYPDLALAEQEIVWRTLPLFRGLTKLIVETNS